MRSLIIAFLSTLLTASVVMAGFSLKSGVYRMDQLDEAKAEAHSTGKAVAFLYSNEKTTCPLCAGSSQYAMEQLMDSCVVIYAARDDWAKLPKPVRAAISAPAAGKLIPKIVVMNPDLKEVIVTVPYARGQEYKLRIYEAKEKISRY